MALARIPMVAAVTAAAVMGLAACGGSGGGAGQAIQDFNAKADQAVTGWTDSAGRAIAKANQKAGEAFDNAGRAIDSHMPGQTAPTGGGSP